MHNASVIVLPKRSTYLAETLSEIFYHLGAPVPLRPLERESDQKLKAGMVGRVFKGAPALVVDPFGGSDGPNLAGDTFPCTVIIGTQRIKDPLGQCVVVERLHQSTSEVGTVGRLSQHTPHVSHCFTPSLLNRLVDERAQGVDARLDKVRGGGCRETFLHLKGGFEQLVPGDVATEVIGDHLVGYCPHRQRVDVVSWLMRNGVVANYTQQREVLDQPL